MTTFDVSKAHGRLWTYLHFAWGDSGLLRLAFTNAHWISDELVRTNQPWPFQLKAWAAKGVRTVINLRGQHETDANYVLERDACRRLGLNLVTFSVGSRDAPKPEKILAAKRLFETIEYPALIHCKAGADRAGVMSVLYMHFRRGAPISEAIKQLHPRFLHIRQSMTGVLDRVFELYMEEGELKGLSFLEWTQSPAYDPVEIRRHYRANWWGTVLIDRLLRRE